MANPCPYRRIHPAWFEGCYSFASRVGSGWLSRYCRQAGGQTDRPTETDRRRDRKIAFRDRSRDRDSDRQRQRHRRRRRMNTYVQKQTQAEIEAGFSWCCRLDERLRFVNWTVLQRMCSGETKKGLLLRGLRRFKNIVSPHVCAPTHIYIHIYDVCICIYIYIHMCIYIIHNIYI